MRRLAGFVLLLVLSLCVASGYGFRRDGLTTVVVSGHIADVDYIYHLLNKHHLLAICTSGGFNTVSVESGEERKATRIIKADKKGLAIWRQSEKIEADLRRQEKKASKPGRRG